MTMQTTGMERALGAIGTTFRMTRLYPPIHPALVEAVRQVSETLPALSALGTIEWKVGATGLHWQGHHLLPRNSQVAELAGLLFARGIRAIRATPGVEAEHVLALFNVAMGSIPPDDRSLGQLTLSSGRTTQRLSRPTPTPQRGTPLIDIDRTPPLEAPAAVPPPAAIPTSPNAPVRRATAEFQPDAIPVDVAVRRAIAEFSTAATTAERQDAVARLQALTPTVLARRDVGLVAEAVAALDRLLGQVDDPALAEGIGTAAAALADKALLSRMVARLGEARVTGAERDVLLAALGALASVSVGVVLNAYLAARSDMREPYRAVIRRAGDRALEPLQGRLADTDPTVAAAAAELVGLCGAPQAIALLVPLLRHESDFVREAAVTGLTEIGGRENSRPVMPALKDPSVGVRAAAARAIAVAGDLGATTVLVRRLEQEVDEGVVADLLRSIGRLGAPEALETLAKYAEPGGMLKRRSPTVRAAAIEGLARITTREARGLLELYTHDKEPTVRRAAEAAIR
jgi:HEAT repeat protein